MVPGVPVRTAHLRDMDAQHASASSNPWGLEPPLDVAELAECLLHGNAVGVVAGLGDLFGFGEGVEVRARIVCRTVG
jgi:hypothetical protein